MTPCSVASGAWGRGLRTPSVPSNQAEVSVFSGLFRPSPCLQAALYLNPQTESKLYEVHAEEVHHLPGLAWLMLTAPHSKIFCQPNLNPLGFIHDPFLLAPLSWAKPAGEFPTRFRHQDARLNREGREAQHRVPLQFTAHPRTPGPKAGAGSAPRDPVHQGDLWAPSQETAGIKSSHRQAEAGWDRKRRPAGAQGSSGVWGWGGEGRQGAETQTLQMWVGHRMGT